MIIGYDLDGTICDGTPKRSKPYFKQTGLERKAYEQVKINHYRNANVVMRPNVDNFIIITGRNEKYREVTREWLKANNINPEALYMHKGQRTRKEMIAFKLKTCREYHVSLYYEDDPKIAKALVSPEMTVILV